MVGTVALSLYHKPHFFKQPQSSLTKPSPNELDRISKSILDKTSPQNLIKVNLWKDTIEVIQWL